MVAGDEVPLNPFKCARYGCRSSFRRVAASVFARCASAETLAARAWALASIARSRASDVAGALAGRFLPPQARPGGRGSLLPSEVLRGAATCLLATLKSFRDGDIIYGLCFGQE